MYEDLVKRLRSVKDIWQTEEETWMLDAADAIEELSKRKECPFSHDDGKFCSLLGTYVSRYQKGDN